MLYHLSMITLASALLLTSAASAANVDVNVNIGAPPIVVREVAPLPPPTRTVIIEDIPDFIYPNQLGFYVAVGVPYDLFFLDGYYYMFRNHKWHRGYDHNGPWKVVREKQLPYGLRKHKLERIRHHRDREFVVYKRDHERYRGKYFRPDKEWRDRRQHDKREYKEERKREQHEWKDDRREDRSRGRDDRHDDHGRGRDDRREDHSRGNDDDRGHGRSGRDR